MENSRMLLFANDYSNYYKKYHASSLAIEIQKKTLISIAVKVNGTFIST